MRTKHIDPETIDVGVLKQEFERLRGELLGAKDKLSGQAHEALEQLGAYLDSEKLSKTRAGLEDEFEKISHRLRDSGREAVGKLEDEVGHRPIAAVALAFGVGLLAAQFFRRG